jgi:hypothetical protein
MQKRGFGWTVLRTEMKGVGVGRVVGRLEYIMYSTPMEVWNDILSRVSIII